MRFLSLCLTIVISIPFLAQANNCTELLSYQSKKLFSAQELYAYETLAAALLSSKVGEHGFKGIERVRIDSLDFLDSGKILQNISESQKKEIEEFVLGGLRNLFYGGHERGETNTRYYRKKSGWNGYFYINMRNLAISTKDREAELVHFIRKNIDAIIINASIMPYRNKLFRDIRNSVVTATVLGSPGTAFAVLRSDSPIFVLGGILYNFGIGMWQFKDNRADDIVEPTWSPFLYDNALGFGVRSEYAFD